MTEPLRSAHDGGDDITINPTIDRVLSRRAQALADDDGFVDRSDYDGEQLEREERSALRRVQGLSTELEDITEVEYRQLRLERVVLAAVWTDGRVEDAENSLRELAALAETAGSEVLAGVLQRRQNPDPGTYLGSGKALELRDIVVAEGADTVVCDDELSPSQRRPRGRRQGQGHRSHGADPRHLRPARHLARGSRAGRAGPADLPPAASARLG